MPQNRDGSRRPSANGRGGPPRRPRPPAPKPGYPAVPPPKRDQRPRPIDPSDRTVQPPPPPPRHSSVPAPQPLYEPRPAFSYPPGLNDPGQDLDLDSPDYTAPAAAPHRLKLPLWEKMAKNWTLWSLVSLAAVGSVGVVSAVSLFRIPNLPNCRAIFWPTASATTRIQCAQAYAEQGTVEGYLEAIKLVEKLPDDHPLRSEINERVEDWASRILDIAEETFQSGKLKEAIDITDRIPSQTAAAGLVNERVAQWSQIWEEAESLYAAAETDLKNRNFNDAFTKAIQLLDVGNRYWQTTKYEELTQLITSARADLNKLGDARRLARQGTLEGFLEAIKLATSISAESPMYAESQELLKEFGQDMLDLAEAALERQDAQAATEILKNIPTQANLSAEIADFRTLADAYQLSWQGGNTALEGAIVRLQSISQDRPLYGKAQSLMSRWRTEIEGRSRLDWARRLAEPGTIADLEAAIAEAELVSRSNPVWEETRSQIGEWQDRIATAQDRPYLSQAEQLAQSGDLERAIEAAQQVRSGRPLYREAQTLVGQWRDQIQRSEDGPILAQARDLAAAGRLQDAVAVASQIGSNRALYSDARSEIDRWQSQIQSQNRLQAAYRAAETGTLDALISAIGIAREVPESNAQYVEAQQAVSRWSWDIFRLAETEAQYNLNRAIDVARRVPTRTEAFAPAQLKIQEWQSALQQSGRQP
ncbi:MAG: chromosome segregation ATPase [Cyanobacteria bacterium Co-bin13]|nr:chromosome segregation ATPase [Cyanobacteria bacterium Co-bin13]